jgi:hypothetical protein
MPLTPSLPTWAAWNNANFTSASGLTDSMTGQPVNVGGLNLGDYFDATNGEAAIASNPANGTLYSGRYRLVQIDSGATAANVKTGTVGFIKVGGTSGSIRTAIITAAGTGATTGTYSIAATLGSGGGSGAVIQVVVAGGAITSASVLNSGYGYSSAPSFSLTTTGTAGGAVVAQLDSTPNIVTSADQIGVTALAVRPVVFLNSITPGNFGFIQELGTATVLNPASTTQTAGNFAITNGTNGVMAASSATLTYLGIGTVLDTVVNTAPANTPFKIQLGYACGTVQD